MKCKGCLTEVPTGMEDAIMPCGKCFVCCDHLHFNGREYPRGTSLMDALMDEPVIFNPTGVEAPSQSNEGAGSLTKEDGVCEHRENCANYIQIGQCQRCSRYPYQKPTTDYYIPIGDEPPDCPEVTIGKEGSRCN